MKYYLRTLLFSVIILSFCSLYILYTDKEITFINFNKSIADVSVILISFSLAFSGISFFWKTFAKYEYYRKYLGITGFVYALIHVTITLTILLNSYNIINSTSNVIAFICGLLAFIIFLIMLDISNKYAIELLGSHFWKIIMRSGYFGLLLVIIHIYLKDIEIWNKWWSGMIPVPPLSFLLFTLSISIICLRVLIQYLINIK